MGFFDSFERDWVTIQNHRLNLELMKKQERSVYEVLESKIEEIEMKTKKLDKRKNMIDSVIKNIKFTKSMSDTELKIFNNNYLKTVRYGGIMFSSGSIDFFIYKDFKQNHFYKLFDSLVYFDPLAAFLKSVEGKVNYNYPGAFSGSQLNTVLTVKEVFDKLIHRKLTEKEYLGYIKGEKVIKFEQERLNEFKGIKLKHKEVIKSFWLNYKNPPWPQSNYKPPKRH